MERKVLFIIGLYLSFTLHISAQTSINVLQKSIAALRNWESVNDFEYATNRINIDKWQGYDFDHALPENDSFHLFFDVKGNRFLHHTQNHYPGGYVFDTYRLGRNSTYYVYDGIGSRTGKDLLNLGSSSFDNRKNSLLNNFPYFLLKQVLREIKDEPVRAEGKDLIVLKKTPNGTEEYRFDTVSFLLNKITRIQGKDTIIQRFENYIPTDGLMAAGRSSLERNGNMVYTDSLTFFKYNQNLASSIFDFPPGYNQTTENTLKLSAKTIAKDVYLIENVDGDRNIMFVNMGNYIVLTEAPISSGTTKSILEVIHTTLPNIPIKYVHLSHFHNDHVAGIAEVVKDGATIICSENMKQPVISMLLNTDSTLYKNGKVNFEVFKDKKVLKNGDKKLEFIELPNSHAKGMSFLYLPHEKIIYQGDLLSLPSDSYTTPAIAVTKEFNDFLRQKKITFTKMIGHHGLPIISKETFDEIVNMKEKDPLFKNTFEH